MKFRKISTIVILTVYIIDIVSSLPSAPEENYEDADLFREDHYLFEEELEFKAAGAGSSGSGTKTKPKKNKKGQITDPDPNSDAELRKSVNGYRLTEPIFKYRVVNWCVNGNDDDDFWNWPLNQFRWYLLKKNKKFQKWDPEFEAKEIPDPNPYSTENPELYSKYEEDHENYINSLPNSSIVPKVWLEFNAIQCEPEEMDLWNWTGYERPGSPGTTVAYDNGDPIEFLKKITNDSAVKFHVPIGQNPPDLAWAPNLTFADETQWKLGEVNKFVLHQRVHLKLKTDYELGVEGILIQANHAPFGTGFPFGQFYDKEDSEDYSPCDCPHSKYAVVPCLSRPDFQTMAPTIAVFHHQMSFLEQVDPQGSSYPKTYVEAGRRKEWHFNFKWDSSPCSSASLVEFFVLIVYDFQRRKYEIRRFGPYDFSAWNDVGYEYNNYKGTLSAKQEDELKVHNLRIFGYENENLKCVGPTETWNETIANQKERFLNAFRVVSHLAEDDAKCPDPNPVLALRKNKVPIYIQQHLLLPSPIFPNCRTPRLEPSPAYCSPEEYGQCLDVQYSMKCHVPIPKSQLALLAVAKVLRTLAQLFFKVPRCIPGSVGCIENPEVQYPVILLPDNVPRIRVNGLFDTQCISYYAEGIPNKQCSNWSSLLKCTTSPFDEGLLKITRTNFELQHKDKRRKLLNGSVEDGSGDSLDPFFEDTLCLPCEYQSTTNSYTPPDESLPFFKRKAHSTLMIICFHLVLPIAILIARHYKETFHTRESKGWRLWLWLHFGLCTFGSLIGYAGYTIPTFWEMDTHMIVGATGIFLCGMGLFTGWLRHRRPRVNWALQTLHSVPSYAGLYCGCLGFHFVEDISLAAHVMAVIPPCLLVLLILLMQVPICCSDRRIGMHPRRKIFPIQQIRFETQLTPLHKCRIIGFGVYCFCSTVFAFLLMIF